MCVPSCSQQGWEVVRVLQREGEVPWDKTGARAWSAESREQEVGFEGEDEQRMA